MAMLIYYCGRNLIKLNQFALDIRYKTTTKG